MQLGVNGDLQPEKTKLKLKYKQQQKKKLKKKTKPQLIDSVDR